MDPLPHMEKMPEQHCIFFHFLGIDTNVPEVPLFHNKVLKDFRNYATITVVSLNASLDFCRFSLLKV